MTQTELVKVFLYAFVLYGQWRAENEAGAGNAPTRPDPALAAVLDDWARASASVRHLKARVQCTEENRFAQTRRVSFMTVQALHAGTLRVDWTDAREQPTDVFLYLGRGCRWFDFRDRRERVFTLSDAPLHELTPDAIVGILPRAIWVRCQWLYTASLQEDLREQFDVRLVDEDRYYSYLRLWPRRTSEFRGYELVSVALVKETHFPRQVIFDRSFGERIRYDFEEVTINGAPSLALESFTKGLPDGWRNVELSQCLGTRGIEALAVGFLHASAPALDSLEGWLPSRTAERGGRCGTTYVFGNVQTPERAILARNLLYAGAPLRAWRVVATEALISRLYYSRSDLDPSQKPRLRLRNPGDDSSRWDVVIEFDEPMPRKETIAPTERR